MKITKLAAGVAVAFISVVGLSAPATASDAELVESVEVQPLGEAPNWGVTNEELAELVGMQSDAEIEAIQESDKAAVLLADDDGNIIAAAYAKPQAIPFLLLPR